MNIDNNVVSEEKKKSDKLLKIIIILIVITVLLSSVIIGVIYYLQQTEFKFTIDGKSVKSYSNDLFLFDGAKIYISIKDLAPFVGYKAYNGSYGNQEQYSEDITKCYVEGKDEFASFELDSNEIYKVNKNNTENYGYYTISEPVKQINNKLYISADGIVRAYNLIFDYSQKNNKITIYTLSYLVSAYGTSIKNASLTEFNNQKALLYNVVIASNSSSTGEDLESKKYGVATLNGTEVIGAKYKSIEFIEASKEFVVTTVNDKVGIIALDGTTKIQPQYDKMKQIDNNPKLYLVENNNKQGVIDENGKSIIYLEYDKIGVDLSKYPTSSDIKNSYILFDNCIPVCKNEEWGMYDKTGKIILPIEYDGIGSIVDTNIIENGRNVLAIPEIKGIVISKIANEKTYYGIVNYKGNSLVPIALTSVYSVLNQGRQDYYMINLNKVFNVVEWVNKRVNTIKEETQKQEKNVNEEMVNGTVNEEIKVINTTKMVNETVD